MRRRAPGPISVRQKSVSPGHLRSGLMSLDSPAEGSQGQKPQAAMASCSLSVTICRLIQRPNGETQLMPFSLADVPRHCEYQALL